jgi:hypothetical protein
MVALSRAVGLFLGGANIKLILELLVPCPISLAIRTSGGVLRVCLNLAFVGDD